MRMRSSSVDGDAVANQRASTRTGNSASGTVTSWVDHGFATVPSNTSPLSLGSSSRR